jgi:putative copper resistance protein D
MQGFADFVDSLLGGTILVALSLAVGGVAWGLVVLRPWQGAVESRLLQRAIGLIALGAALLALAQAALLGVKVLLLADYLGPGAFASFTTTLQFRAGVTRAAIAAVLAIAALWLRGRPTSMRGWSLVAVLASGVTFAGAWLVHAAGRLEGRATLMTLTVLHQVGAAVWVGGVVQLVALWQLARRDPGAAAVWPELVARFSRVAMVALVGLLAAGVPLVLRYVDSVDGLIGTGYGSLVVTKVALLAVVLFLAAFNYRAARRGRDPEGVRRRLPHLAEAEMILLVILLFVAASLSSQPPPVDGGIERATWPELVEVFRPKWPALRTPSVADKLADAATATAPALDWKRTNLAYSWSNFTHNVAGLFLLAMAALALAGLIRPAWGQLWPLGLVGLGVFVFLRTSASEGTWPFGSTGVLENALADAEALQHRIGAGLALALGLLEWRARAAPRSGRTLPYVFPVLAAVGGVVLLTHAHTAFEPKSSYLIQITHVSMGTLAVLMACGRWLELRVGPPIGRAGGAASTIAMLLLALVLVFYREANVVLPGE